MILPELLIHVLWLMGKPGAMREQEHGDGQAKTHLKVAQVLIRCHQVQNVTSHILLPSLNQL